jgi:hypothetical protein
MSMRIEIDDVSRPQVLAPPKDQIEPTITVQAQVDFSDLDRLGALQPGLPLRGTITVKNETVYNSLLSL